ncbi:protein of unknown function DUF132 [Candidatus Magnetoovum chiemensis]|nr:protein of unknown function DUF132 [Candidatus Magnetoovum chiemensis]
MIRVVLDANIFVSAIISPKGNSSRIIFLIEQERNLKLITSLSILEEVKRVLFYPIVEKYHKNNKEEIKIKLEKITQFAEITSNQTNTIDVIKTDPDDNKYLECAVEGNANYIVSGDYHLLELESFQGIGIVTPAEFLKIAILQSKN